MKLWGKHFKRPGSNNTRISNLYFKVRLFVFVASLFCHSVGNAKENYVFALQGLNSPFDASMLDRQYVDGMALQIGWKDVETTSGRYNWSRVDQFVNEVAIRKKHVTLHLLSLHPPEWVFASGVEKHCFSMLGRGDFIQNRTLCDALPWDKLFLEKWSKLILEFGKRYGANESVLAVSITAPTPEMVLPGAIPGSDAFIKFQKRYDKAIYLDAWKQMIDTYQLAFPDKVKFIAPGIVLFDEYFADEVITYAHSRYGMKLWLFNAGLRADGIPQLTMGTGHIAKLLETYQKNGGGLGLQTIWNASDDPRNRMRGDLVDVLEAGMKMGAIYFEVYAVDVLNPLFRGDLEKFKKKLELAK